MSTAESAIKSVEHSPRAWDNQSPKAICEIDDGVAVVQLNRPDVLNAIDLDLIDELIAVAEELSVSTDLRAVVLTGAGRSFCAGLDFGSAFKQKRRVARYFLAFPRKQNRFQKFVTIWRDLDVPVIAVVHGHCFGGGAQLAAGADFRFTTPDAQWSIMEAKWGLVPDMGGTVPFLDVMALDVIQRLAMTGEIVSGDQAAELGMATAAADDPMAEAMALVQQLKERSPDSVAATKRLFIGNARTSLRAALRRERRLQAKMFKSPNTKVAREAGVRQTAPKFGVRTLR